MCARFFGRAQLYQYTISSQGTALGGALDGSATVLRADGAVVRLEIDERALHRHVEVGLASADMARRLRRLGEEAEAERIERESQGYGEEKKIYIYIYTYIADI
jgi:hypothetical protein